MSLATQIESDELDSNSSSIREILLLNLPAELVLLVVSFLDNASRASFGYTTKRCAQYTTIYY